MAHKVRDANDIDIDMSLSSLAGYYRYCRYFFKHYYIEIFLISKWKKNLWLSYVYLSFWDNGQINNILVSLLEKMITQLIKVRHNKYIYIDCVVFVNESDVFQQTVLVFYKMEFFSFW